MMTAKLIIPIQHLPFRAPMPRPPTEAEIARYGGFPPPTPTTPDPAKLLQRALEIDNPQATISRPTPTQPLFDVERIRQAERNWAAGRTNELPPPRIIGKTLLVEADVITIEAKTLREHAPGLQLLPPVFATWR